MSPPPPRCEQIATLLSYGGRRDIDPVCDALDIVERRLEQVRKVAVVLAGGRLEFKVCMIGLSEAIRVHAGSLRRGGGQEFQRFSMAEIVGQARVALDAPQEVLDRADRGGAHVGTSEHVNRARKAAA